MTDRLQSTSAPEISAAIESNLFEFIRLFSHWPEAQLHDGPDLLWTLTDIPFALFNSTFRAKLEVEQVDAAIEAAKDRARSRSVPILWWTGPSTTPADLGSRLETAGFADAGSLPGMAADLAGYDFGLSAAQGLTVERVSDPQTLETWCRTAKEGFEMPDVALEGVRGFFGSVGVDRNQQLRHYLGRVDGKPAATSSLLLGKSVAGIYNVATLPEARRKGLGAAVTSRALQEARDEGYGVAVLQSSDLGAGVYTKLGFREHCRIGNFAWSPSPDEAGTH